MLTDNIKTLIKNHALSDKDNEVCGFILKLKDGSTTIHTAKNISDKPDCSFVISPSDFLSASYSGDIIACYHSQNSENLSESDIRNSHKHNINFALYSKTKNVFNYYSPINIYNSKYEKYLGKYFKLGDNDCFSLVREFYHNEFNIDIFNYSRGAGWYKNKNLIGDNIKNENFTKVISLQYGDLICLDSYKTGYPTHLKIYLDNNECLEHLRKYGSCITPYTKQDCEQTSYILRHLTLCLN